MSRPRKKRFIENTPTIMYFKPWGIRLSSLEEVVLSYEELECIRLSNIKKLNQTEGAEKMGVHQSTFHRILLSAREKIADALVNGKAIKIEGGCYDMRGRNINNTGRSFGRGMGRGGGPPEKCKCPQCGYEEAHVRGKPCYTVKCPKCNINLTRS